MNVVKETLSSLKACQEDIGTGMDLVTDVAMDLVEAEGKCLKLKLLQCERCII